MNSGQSETSAPSLCTARLLVYTPQPDAVS
jgi:hypothetical protein